MKKGILSTLTALLMISFPATAYSDSVLHIWSCKLNDEKTEDDLMKVSSAWLKVAKGMDGGADIEVFVDYAIFSNTPDSEDGSFSFVLMTPDLKSWGTLFNDYPDSPLAKADEVWGEVADCSDSSLLSSVKVE